MSKNNGVLPSLRRGSVFGSIGHAMASAVERMAIVRVLLRLALHVELYTNRYRI